MQVARHLWIRVFTVCVCVLFCAAVLIPLRAQDAGTLAGAVLDQTGKAIRGATVVVRNDATGVSRTVTTDSDGHFSAAGLPAGTYTTEAVAPGLRTPRGIQLPGQKQRSLDRIGRCFRIPGGHCGGGGFACRAARAFRKRTGCNFRQDGDQRTVPQELHFAGFGLQRGDPNGAGRL